MWPGVVAPDRNEKLHIYICFRSKTYVKIYGFIWNLFGTYPSIKYRLCLKRVMCRFGRSYGPWQVENTWFLLNNLSFLWNLYGTWPATKHRLSPKTKVIYQFDQELLSQMDVIAFLGTLYGTTISKNTCAAQKGRSYARCGQEYLCLVHDVQLLFICFPWLLTGVQTHIACAGANLVSPAYSNTLHFDLMSFFSFQDFMYQYVQTYSLIFRLTE